MEGWSKEEERGYSFSVQGVVEMESAGPAGKIRKKKGWAIK